VCIRLQRPEHPSLDSAKAYLSVNTTIHYNTVVAELVDSVFAPKHPVCYEVGCSKGYRNGISAADMVCVFDISDKNGLGLLAGRLLDPYVGRVQGTPLQWTRSGSRCRSRSTCFGACLLIKVLYFGAIINVEALMHPQWRCLRILSIIMMCIQPHSTRA
jgi:hypothetical protein